MLRIRGLRVEYGDLVAVDDLDLDAAGGEVLALLGPNGAGKSSAVRCLVGLQEPAAGRVEIAGIDAHRDPAAARRATGYVPEVARLHDALTPREHLLLRGRLFDLDEEEITGSIEHLLDGFDLLPRADEPMSSFSKGMVQKVCIAAALLTRPRLLILDEPLSGLDVVTTMVVKELMRAFAAGGGTVLYCSHLLDVVETVADRVAVLDRGRRIAFGTIPELRESAGSDGDQRLEALFRRLTEASDPAERARKLLQH